MRALSPQTATGAVILAIHMAWLLIEALRSGCPPLFKILPSTIPQNLPSSPPSFRSAPSCAGSPPPKPRRAAQEKKQEHRWDRTDGQHAIAIGIGNDLRLALHHAVQKIGADSGCRIQPLG